MIQYIKEPTDLQCGQAVIAMAAGINVDEVIAFLGNDRETDLKEMRRAFEHWGIKMSPSGVQVKDNSPLPSM